MLGADLDQISVNGPDLVLMILTAVICGVLLGYERQRKGKPVGILTASLVALGSTLFVLSGSLLADSGVPLIDASRLPSMIVSGIGFIGAGAIMRSKFNVTGLASAATIWALGSLGILIGTGHVVLALLAALAIFFLLRLIPKLEHALFRQRYCLHATVTVQRDALDKVLQFLMENELPISHSQTERQADQVVLTMNQCGIESQPQVLGSLRDLEGVLQVVDHLGHS